MDCQATWFKNTLVNAKQNDSPFQFSLLNKIFDPNDFQQLVDSAPSFDELPVLKEKTNEKRRSLFIHPPTINKYLPPNKQTSWSQLYWSIKNNADEIKSLALNSHHIQPIFSGLTIENLSIGLRLVIENLPFTIPPHVDTLQKFAVIIIYLDSKKIKNNGTSIYTQNYNQFKPYTRLDFNKNGGIILPRTPSSWHGGNWQGTGERKTIHLYFFRHKKEAAQALRTKNQFFI